MAYNGYGQHWQQQQQPPPQSRQPRPDRRPDPRAFNDYGQPHQMEPPRQRLHKQRPEYHSPHNGYNDGYSGGYGDYNTPQYDQHHQQGGWHDNQYQEPYQHHDQYQNQYNQQPQGRTYHYDERYRNNGQERMPVMNNHPPVDERPPREKHRPAPLPEVKKSKPKERILTEPTSPKTLPWDNPFGAFPPKKKEKEHKKHASLNEATKDNSLAVGSFDRHDQRPHTSQDHRQTPDASRPSTSHGHHRTEPPPESPRLPIDTNMPLRKPPAPSQLRDELPVRPSGPQRSVTQPSPQAEDSQFREYGGVDPYGYNQQNSHNSSHQQQPDQMRQTFDHGQAPTETRRKPAPEPAQQSQPQPQPQPQRQQQQRQQESYRGVPLYKPTSNQSNYAQSPPRDGPEMPNFDAISPQVDENHLGATPPSQDQPAYAKKPYQAFAQPDSRSNQPQAQPAVQSPLSDFQFDLQQTMSNRSAPPAPLPVGLPSNPAPRKRVAPGNIEPGGYSNSPRSPTYGKPPMSPRRQQYDQQRNFDPRLQKRNPTDPTYQQAPSNQFPPRGASRPEPQHRSTSDGHPANGNMNHLQPASNQLPPRPNTSNAHIGSPPNHDYGSQSNGYNNGYDQSYEEPSNNDYGYDQGYRPDERYQGRNYDYNNPQYPDQQYSPVTSRAQPQRGHAPPQNFSPAQSRPQTSGSGHPPPVRSYGERRSVEGHRPDLPPAVIGGIGDRPPPIRPGLIAANTPPPAPAQPVQAPPPQQRGPPPPQNDARPEQPPVTIAELNQMRETFKNNPNDYPLGLRFAKRLVEAASVLATEGGRADPKTAQKNRERYIFDATKIVKKLCASGYPEAMFYLADCHGQGLLGLAPDPKEAFQLYQSAAKLNHPQSAYRVAVCCELGAEDGGGTRRDPLKAIQWYKRAATLGDPPAMYKMGMIQLKGLLGQPKDPRQAVSWLKRASERADRDNPHALHELGLLYESAAPTDHIIKDERYALQLFTQASELGYKYSQFRLGSAYEYGLLTCPVDPRQSIAWYTKAASQGEHQSELALSGWYLTGAEGLLQQSDTEAYLWARKAASSGLAKAEYAMGYFSEAGIGTGVDVEEAKRWYYRAAAQNMTKARDRLEALKRGAPNKRKERISRSGKQEGDCVVM